MRLPLLITCLGVQLLIIGGIASKDSAPESVSVGRAVRPALRAKALRQPPGIAEAEATAEVALATSHVGVPVTRAQNIVQYIPVAASTMVGFPIFVPVLYDAAWGDPGYGPSSSSTTWTMINVCPNQGQADCHLLEFPDGTHALIDAGEGYDAHGAAVKYLEKAGIKHIELVVLSHVHWDHYGKLIDIINSGIQVDRVAVNLPGSRAIADAEIPWGCNWDEVQALLTFLKQHNIPVWTPRFGEKLVDLQQAGIQTLLEVVCYYNGVNTPIGRSDINDTSMILRLTHGATKALFTGDLNMPLGTWLATSSFDLKADILKVPHHGTEGLAPNSFFDQVAPQVALVPSPIELWYSLRSKRAREYFKDHGIPTYVSGIDGTVKVTMTGSSYEISNELKP